MEICRQNCWQFKSWRFLVANTISDLWAKAYSYDQIALITQQFLHFHIPWRKGQREAKWQNMVHKLPRCNRQPCYIFLVINDVMANALILFEILNLKLVCRIKNSLGMKWVRVRVSLLVLCINFQHWKVLCPIYIINICVYIYIGHKTKCFHWSKFYFAEKLKILTFFEVYM